jgi:predicted transposase YbfD/YdcC
VVGCFLGVCLFLKLAEMEWNGSILTAQNSSCQCRFGQKNEEQNDYVFCSVPRVHNKSEHAKHVISPNQNLQR